MSSISHSFSTNLPKSYSKSPTRIRSTLYKRTARLEQLSQPKISSTDYEEVVGPGSYSPNDYFLSTNTKAPTMAIMRSERFIKIKVPIIRDSMKKYTEKSNDNVYLISENATPPSYSFKRTGHDLRLVRNPEFPGVGRYTPQTGQGYNSFSFSKASKKFNWKKGKFLHSEQWDNLLMDLNYKTMKSLSSEVSSKKYSVVWSFRVTRPCTISSFS